MRISAAHDQLDLDLPRERPLYELLERSPATLDDLIHATGWTQQVTQQALLRLIADARIQCRLAGSKTIYATRKGRGGITSEDDGDSRPNHH